MQPTKRSSPARRGNRRSHDRLRPTHLVACPNCGANKVPHAACSNCGYVRPGLTLNLNPEEE